MSKTKWKKIFLTNSFLFLIKTDFFAQRGLLFVTKYNSSCHEMKIRLPQEGSSCWKTKYSWCKRIPLAARERMLRQKVHFFSLENNLWNIWGTSGTIMSRYTFGRTPGKTCRKIFLRNRLEKYLRKKSILIRRGKHLEKAWKNASENI